MIFRRATELAQRDLFLVAFVTTDIQYTRTCEYSARILCKEFAIYQYGTLVVITVSMAHQLKLETIFLFSRLDPPSVLTSRRQSLCYPSGRDSATRAIGALSRHLGLASTQLRSARSVLPMPWQLSRTNTTEPGTQLAWKPPSRSTTATT